MLRRWACRAAFRDEEGQILAALDSTACQQTSSRRSNAEDGSLHLAHFLQSLEIALHSIQPIFARLVLHHIPLGLALAFAECKNGLPVHVTLADHPFGSGAMSFDMDGLRAARVLLQHRNRISPAFAAVAFHELLDDGDQIPRPGLEGVALRCGVGVGSWEQGVRKIWL